MTDSCYYGLGRHRYSPPQKLQLQLLTRPQSSLFGSHAERGNTEESARGDGTEENERERVSPGLFLLLIITPRSLLDLPSLFSINGRLRDDW